MWSCNFCLQKCPDGGKLRHAPLDNEYKVRIVTNEQAVVLDAIPDVGTSHVKLEEDEAGSGCEGFGCNASTSIDGKVGKKRAMQYSPSPKPSKRRQDQDSYLQRVLDLVEKKSRKNSEEAEEIAQMLNVVIEDGAKKGSAVYSYATQLFKKKEIRDMFSIFEKQDGRLEWLERTWDPVRWEVRRMMHMVVEDGVKVGSDEYFYASQLCMKKECRDVFTTLKTPNARLAWIKRTWEEQKH
jgi:hypothetical protein